MVRLNLEKCIKYCYKWTVYTPLRISVILYSKECMEIAVTPVRGIYLYNFNYC